MGRPLNRQQFFGIYQGSNISHQIISTTWGTADSSAVPGVLTKQNSTNRFRAKTINGSSLTTLSNGTPTKAGYSSVKLFPDGTDPIVYATATANLKAVSAAVVNGGTQYNAADVLNLVGGTYGNVATLTVNTVFANNAVATFTLNAVANQKYTALPANLAAVSTVDTSNANGTGAIFSVNFGLEKINVINGGSNYTSANIILTQATVAPVITSTVTGGVLQNNVVVSSPGVINVGNPTVTVEGTSGTTEYVKNIQSASQVLTFSGNVYNWLYKGQPVPADYANLNIKIGYLDTL